MSYGKPKYAFKIGDRIKVDLKRNGKLLDGEVIGIAPRIGALTAGSIEWLVFVDGGNSNGRWVSEAYIEVAS